MKATALKHQRDQETEAEARTAAVPVAHSLIEYAERYRRIDDQRFSLEAYEPLRAVYEDDSKHICVMKPSQVGVSEWAITKTLWVLDQGAKAFDLPKNGLNVGYIFPTDKALSSFSKERWGGIKTEHEHFTQLFGASPYDDVLFKQVGNSFLYLRGGNSEAGLISFSADMVVRDEYDKIDPEARSLAEKRMNNSMLAHLLDLSTPTLPGMGIHELFLQSDQHIYLQRCPHCGAQNSYDFFRDVVVDGKRYDVWERYEPQRIRRSDVALTCPNCSALLTKQDRCVKGTYVPQQPDVRGLRGYHVPALAFPRKNLLELAVKAVDKTPTNFEQFMRQDLGVPYHSKGSGLSEEDLLPLSMDLDNGRLPVGAWERNVMGADIGAKIHVCIMGRLPGQVRPYLRLMRTVESWLDLDNLMIAYRIRMACVDSLPENSEARKFVNRWKGRAVMADYPTQMNALKGQLFAPDSEKAVQDGFIRVNRTMVLDTVQANIIGGQEHWPTEFIEDSEVRAHMTGMARVTSIDTRGQVVASWVRLRADHYLHARGYAHIASQLTPKTTRPRKVVQSTAKTKMPGTTGYHRAR